MKKALVLASVASMIDQFNMPNIRLLIELGYKVDVACNFLRGNTCSDDKIVLLKETLEDMNVGCYQVDFARNVLNVLQNLKAYSQTKKIVKEGQYNLIHSHSPIGGLLSRIAARDMRNKGTKVIYTAHGFHFYNGAPVLNWLIFYPIEKIASRWTDVLVTITREDYDLAQRRMNAKEVIFVPGVGINTAEFNPGDDAETLRKQKRDELSLTGENIVLLSVGELNKNKNHEVVIRAMAQLKNNNVHYVIAGRGVLKEYLEKLAKALGIERQLHLLGFRTDVRELYKAADVFIHPSFREGLSVAMMEAMASAMPIICTRIRGNVDLIDDGKGGYLFDPSDVEGAYIAIKKIVENSNRREMGTYNMQKAESLDIKGVIDKMRKIYAINS